MKTSLKIIVVLLALFFNSCTTDKIDISSLETSENIRLNQIGYLTDFAKKIIVADSKASEFKLVDTSGNIVFSGLLEDKGEWELSKEIIKIADFSSFTIPGTYMIYIEDMGLSYPFSIGSEIYSDVLKSSVKAFYLQRASMPVEEKYAGVFNHPIAHPDDYCMYHPSWKNPHIVNP